MSAYIVSDEIINLLANFAYVNDIRLWNVEKNRLSRQGIAEILIEENYKSVNYRYHDKAEPHKPKTSIIPFIKLSSVAEAVSEYEYQACETKEYRKSIAFSLLFAIKDEILRKVSKS